MDPLFLLAVVVLSAIFFALARYLSTYREIDAQVHSEVYFDKTADRSKLPPLYQNATLDISFIVPAYNESQRITSMLNETAQYLRQRIRRNPNFRYEIIVVNDGSKDNTAQVVTDYAKQNSDLALRVITYPDGKNRGKGGAVQFGALNALGNLILMVDADGATDIKDLDRLEEKLASTSRDRTGVAVGSRAHMKEEEGGASASRTLIRNLIGSVFHGMVAILCVPGIKDTQCGFKLFTRRSARVVFANQHLKRWIFDVELLFIANRHNHPMVEVPVNWQEIDGSKLNVVLATLQMARDLFLIRLFFTTHTWTIRDPVVY